MSIDDVSRPRKSRPKHFFHVHWRLVTPETSKKKQPGTFAISKMIGKISHHHSVTVSKKDKCYIRHVLLVIVGKSRTSWWGWKFIPLFTSGSTTHIGIFSFRVHKAPISTHNRNAFFASSFSSPISFQNLYNIWVLSSGFFFQQTW